MSINRVPVTKNVPPAVDDRLAQSMHTDFQLLENHQFIMYITVYYSLLLLSSQCLFN